jgi:hypothetical protein
MTIEGREYILSIRTAYQVLRLAEECAGRENDLRLQLSSTAIALCDSLAQTYKTLGPVRGWHYRKFTAPGASIWLLEALSIEELSIAWHSLEELEGGKKKLKEQESRSEDPSAVE